jgi:protein-L-isoaspartate(D-aspartate) O-methyltransferase
LDVGAPAAIVMRPLPPLLVALLSAILAGCSGAPAIEDAARAAQAPARGASEADQYAAARARMVREQIEARGVRDARVLAAMRRVPRHVFVPERVRSDAYEDYPLPIGHEQTISQPFIVAWMTEALRVKPGSRVLEIGTGSGYQAAVLAEMGAEVYTIEIVAPLAESAGRTFKALGYSGIRARQGDGYVGWPEHAPFDAIIVTAAPDHVPQPLVEQLAVGGRLVIPVGGRMVQQMTVITKDARGVTSEERMAVRFVPLVRP